MGFYWIHHVSYFDPSGPRAARRRAPLACRARARSPAPLAPSRSRPMLQVEASRNVVLIDLDLWEEEPQPSWTNRARALARSEAGARQG